jgi:hypothetical protein
LYNGPIDAKYSQVTKSGDGSAHLKLYPQPHIEVTIHSPQQQGNVFNLGRDFFPTLEICGQAFTAHRISGEWLMPARTSQSFIIRPPVDPPDYTCVSVTSLVFLVVNFPFLNCPPGQEAANAKPFVLQADTWIWEFQPAPDANQSFSAQSEKPTFDVTYFCRLSLSDGSEFRLSEGLQAMSAMDTLLSFVAGHRIGSIVPAATPHDKNINALLWNQAQLNIDPAGGLRTWYPYPSHEPLQALLSAYWERINADATTPTWLDRAINLWVATNRGQSYADLELIQAVSLLELLSWTILVKTTETISNSAFNDKKKNPLSDSIARTLRHMGVSASIPPEIRPLISKLSIDSDSPQSDIGALVIVKLRNSFVHPSDKNLSAIQEIDSNQVHETLSLALHYAELMILWIVGYRGPYLDRLDSSTTRTPPWTSPA